MKIMHIVGARPNFMKVAPIINAFNQYSAEDGRAAGITQVLVHTGQHYDHEMSKLFFEDLAIPRPEINLEIGSGSHGQQTGRIMEAFEGVLLSERPDLVLVVGDVNSTMACAIDAKKLCIPVAHVEAGLRSRDWTMPEEINRIVTDAISDLLFTTDAGANANLRSEGIPAERIHFVGNVMIDTLLAHRDKALAMPTLDKLGLRQGGRLHPYAVVTLHRPGNVDHFEIFKGIGEALVALGGRMRVVFPVHPRTRKQIAAFGLDGVFSESNNIYLLPPQGYLDFLNLTANAELVLSDSGGIQEETTILGVPCLTLRPNTERPVTIECGTNTLVGNDHAAILAAIEQVLGGKGRKKSVPELWDGNAAQRIVRVIVRRFTENNGTD